MILETGKIGHSLKTQNPFVATMYHNDHFPAGNGSLGPVVEKTSRNTEDGDFDMGADWRMYYGETVPGFPAHPHRGFETVTIVLQGTVDHTVGLGGMGRYENGDVQWMTAGKGLQHAEMFPLRNTEGPNPLELFQIWLSLDHAHRMADPAYKMLWREAIPVLNFKDDGGFSTKVTLFAGELNGQRAPEPAPDSWAKDKGHHLGIQVIELEPGAAYTIPAAFPTMNRSVYFYEGETLRLEDQLLEGPGYGFAQAGTTTALKNEGAVTAKVLLLEAEPIPEPIIAHGPFVMTTREEIREAYQDYQKTEFGGWPFASAEVYHSADQDRFARYADGTVEYPRETES